MKSHCILRRSERTWKVRAKVLLLLLLLELLLQLIMLQLKLLLQLIALLLLLEELLHLDVDRTRHLMFGEIISRDEELLLTIAT